jgi:hypothetical protein
MNRTIVVMAALVALVFGAIGPMSRWQEDEGTPLGRVKTSALAWYQKDDGSGVMLNPAGFMEKSVEATKLDAAERERLSSLRMSPKSLLNPTVFSLNRAALQSRTIIFKAPDGKQFRYIGSPVSGWPRAAWTGKSKSSGGLMIDDTEQELVGEVREGATIYLIGSLPGGPHQVVSVLGSGVFYEPPQMSGHPPFPRGVEDSR